MEDTQQQLKIDFKNTTPIATPEGNKIFQQGFILRQVSKFVVGADEDAVMPIQVFYDPKTNKLLESTIPIDLRD